MFIFRSEEEREKFALTVARWEEESVKHISKLISFNEEDIKQEKEGIKRCMEIIEDAHASILKDGGTDGWFVEHMGRIVDSQNESIASKKASIRRHRASIGKLKQKIAEKRLKQKVFVSPPSTSGLTVILGGQYTPPSPVEVSGLLSREFSAWRAGRNNYEI